MSALRELSPSAYGHVAVCAGGQSAERQVSLSSGAAALQGLLARQISAELVDLNLEFYRRAMAGEFDRVFIAVHGRGGEDGALQGFLDLLQLPYSGTGLAGSVLAMNKQLSKSIWRSAGLPTPEWQIVDDVSALHRAAVELGLPIMVKPVAEGSSVGISLVESESALEQAWSLASISGQPVMAEQFIDGEEYTVSIVLGEALPVIKITTPNKFYDYQAKYESDETGYYCPSGLSQTAEQQIAEIALKAFQAIGGSGWGRVDFMVDQTGQPWLVEANTVPGLTDHSLVPMAARASGWEPELLMERILQSSFESADGANDKLAKSDQLLKKAGTGGRND